MITARDQRDTGVAREETREQQQAEQGGQQQERAVIPQMHGER